MRKRAYFGGGYDDNDRQLKKPLYNDPRKPREESKEPGGGPGGMMVEDGTMIPDSLREKLPTRTVIQSSGRGQPCTKMSLINQTMCIVPFMWQERCKTLPSRMVAPLGPKEALSVQEGEAVYAEASNRRTQMSRRGQFQNFPGREVFDCVNGQDRKTKLVFVGQCNTTIDNANPLSDMAVSVTIAGTVTFVNTGPTKIDAGKRVLFLGSPFVVVENGVVRPAIQQKGIHKEKFRPMLISGDDLASPELAVRAAKLALPFAEEVPNMPAMNPEEELKLVLDKWAELRPQLHPVVIDYAPDRMPASHDDVPPIDIYLFWLLAEQFRGTSLVMQAVENKHVECLGSVTDLSDELRDEGPVTWNELGGLPQQSVHTEMRKAQCLIEHRNWVDRHTVGRAQTTSAPGAPIDVVLGYTN